MSALLLLTHTLTHNRKSASGFSGLFSKPNRHFLSHAAPIGLGITLFFLQGDFGTKRPCVQVTSLRPPRLARQAAKEPGNRVFMRFPGVSVYLWFPAVPAADPYRDPYGIWRTLCVLLGKPLAGRNAWPAFCGKPQNHVFPAIVCFTRNCRFLPSYTRHLSRKAPRWRFGGLGWCFPLPPFAAFFGPAWGACSPENKDLQFPAMRVRIRYGGDFPGIK